MTKSPARDTSPTLHDGTTVDGAEIYSAIYTPSGSFPSIKTPITILRVQRVDLVSTAFLITEPGALPDQVDPTARAQSQILPPHPRSPVPVKCHRLAASLARRVKACLRALRLAYPETGTGVPFDGHMFWLSLYNMTRSTDIRKVFHLFVIGEDNMLTVWWKQWMYTCSDISHNEPSSF